MLIIHILKGSLWVIAAMFLPGLLTAQTVNQLIKAGDKKLEAAEYYAASQYYADALKKDADNAELWYKYAEAARQFNDYGSAAAAYKSVVKLDKSNQFPLATFYAAEMLRGVCECKNEETLTLYKKFKSKYRGKDYFSQKAQQQIESIAWANDHAKKNDSVQIEHLGKAINTPYSEFNAVHVYPDRIQFSSLRNIGGEKKDARYAVRIYNQPPNPSAMYMPNGANENLDIGNGAYSPDSKRFYFTQCEKPTPGTSRCDIYVSIYDDYKWGQAVKLSDHVNAPGATNTHPAAGYDTENNEVLFFASDRSGGQGGLDLWVSKRNADGTYQQAVNLGSTINSPGNEITPFYNVKSGALFFSSDWHYGFGGYDIFETKGEYTNWGRPKNLLQPVNSPQNDLYYSVAPTQQKAYITSNRKGSYFIEAETCCNDIYAYSLPAKQQTKDTTKVVIAEERKIETANAEPKTPVFFNNELRQIKQLLPVTLYFHNDEPDARTLSDTTLLNYVKTYEDYARMRTEYSREFSKGLKGEAKEAARKNIDDFFDSKVETGFRNLIGFSGQLLALLQSGKQVEITIQGYCSPLNYNEYNVQLAKRRIASLRNFMYQYRDGVFLKYIQDNKLMIVDNPIGEETAPTGISDKREDTQNSVYNPAAAKERKVEIISIELK